jgi:hypothetical protein
MKAFIAALALLILLAIVSSLVSLREHRLAGQAGHGILSGDPFGEREQVAR